MSYVRRGSACAGRDGVCLPRIVGDVTVTGDLSVAGQSYLKDGISVGAAAIPLTGDNTEISIYSQNTTKGNIIKTETTIADGASYAEFWAKSAVASWSMYASEKTNSLRFYEYLPTTEVSQDTDRMTIVSGGNVGIGTTTPTARLHIAATADNSNADLRVDGHIISPSLPFGGQVAYNAATHPLGLFIPFGKTLATVPVVTASNVGTVSGAAIISVVTTSGFTAIVSNGAIAIDGTINWIALPQ